LAQEGESRFRERRVVDAWAAWHADHIKRWAVGKGDRRLEDQAGIASDRIQCPGDDVNLGGWNASQRFVRTGQVQLSQVGEGQDADLGIRLAFRLPRLEAP
jgi:hypothetical protein